MLLPVHQVGHCWSSQGTYWRFSQKEFDRLNSDNRIWWGKDGNNVPRVKRFLTDVKDGIVPETLWLHTEVGNTQEAKKELVSICDFEDSASVFITPKPTRLIRRILDIGSDKDSIIFDTLLGVERQGKLCSPQNKADGGTRKCVLVEVLPEVADRVTRQRLQRVCEGYEGSSGVTVDGPWLWIPLLQAWTHTA